MPIVEVECIQNREDFVSFIDGLVHSLKESPEKWENRDLASFLKAMSAWVSDMDGYYINLGEQIPDPDWKVFAHIISAARIYE